MNDIAEFARSRPNVNYRHFFEPSESLGGVKDELDFRNSTTWRFQEIGRKDAKTKLEKSGGLVEQPSVEGQKVVQDHSYTNLMNAHYNTMKAELQKLATHFW